MTEEEALTLEKMDLQIQLLSSKVETWQAQTKHIQDVINMTVDQINVKQADRGKKQQEILRKYKVEGWVIDLPSRKLVPGGGK